MQNEGLEVAAIVLAAGLSRRMGQPKMVLPWGKTTVIGQVVQALKSAHVDEIVVVTGGDHQLVETAVSRLSCKAIFNPRYAEDYMLLSLQTGLSALGGQARAALVALGDQPQIEIPVIRAVVDYYCQSGAELVVPSFHMRRGHPWLVDRKLWPELLAMQTPHTLRDFLNRFTAQIAYLPLENNSILQDLDTPEDYARSTSE